MRRLSSVEGNQQRLDGGALFGNAPKALWNRWCEVDESNRITLACRALLVRDGERNILLETGIGAFLSPALKKRYGVVQGEHVLVRELRAQGLEPSDIDVVVLSHLHFDHAGGMLTAYEEGKAASLVFDNASFVVGAQAWERACNPHVRDRASFIPELVALLKESTRLELVSGETSETLGAGYRFHLSSGHTPGMLLTEIDMPDGPIVFAADLIPGRPWVHLPITMGYDRFPELVIEEKTKLLQSLLERKGRVFYTHDAEVALSSLSVDERGRYSADHCLQKLNELER